METDAVHRSILAQCYRKAQKSPDTSTQLGAVIMNKKGFVQWSTMSFNGFVKGWEPSDEDYERPRKYLLGEHAERRAIYQAANQGIALHGCTLYCTWAACVDCARAIVETGIATLIRHHPPADDATIRWMESVALGDEIMKNGGVEIIDVHGPIPEGFPILRGGEVFDPSR